MVPATVLLVMLLLSHPALLLSKCHRSGCRYHFKAQRLQFWRRLLVLLVVLIIAPRILCIFLVVAVIIIVSVMSMHHALEHVHNLPKAPGGNIHVIDLDQPISEADLSGALDGTEPTALFRRESFPSGQDGQSRLLRRRGVRWAGGREQHTKGNFRWMIGQIDGDDAANVCVLSGGGSAAAAPGAGAAASVTARHLGDVFCRDVLVLEFSSSKSKSH